MAVTQISRIQHRRGLEQDLPQLASAELGWSIDTRQLYIGNGTLDEGAPTVGVTRILTEHDIATITEDIEFTDYTFVGNAAGYVAQTGPSTLSPTIRTYQQKLDDFVNVRDFGAIGNGVTDDTDAINRALQEIYKSTVSTINSRARRTIYFPGGTYLTSSPVLIPPYARLVGDGISSVIISQSRGDQSVATFCDSNFQTGASIGTGGAITPQYIEISGIQFLNSNTSTTRPIFVMDSASDIRIQSCEFRANSGVGFYPNLVSIETSTITTSKITFDSCQFIKGGNGISFIGTQVTSVRVLNSSFDDLSNVAVDLNNSLNFSSIGNYYGSVGGDVISNGNNANFSLADYSLATDAGIRLGNLQIAVSQQVSITSVPLVLTVLANTASAISYDIKQGSNIRFGTFSFVKTDSSILYNDSYVETVNQVGANLSANADSILISVASGTAILNYNYQTFN